MSIIDRFFKSQKSGDERIEFFLPNLMRVFYQEASNLDGRAIDTDLLRARIADGYRDAGLEPIAPEEFSKLISDLNQDELRRMALASNAFELDFITEALPRLLSGSSISQQIKNGFVEFSRTIPLLTMELIRNSPLRAEEFARFFVMAMGASVMGETEEQSRTRLNRINYARLCAEAERAKLSAEERVEYLRKLQEEQEKKFAPRGKW
jgi:hypothetical protein